jgi:hypothetical protein
MTYQMSFFPESIKSSHDWYGHFACSTLGLNIEESVCSEITLEFSFFDDADYVQNGGIPGLWGREIVVNLSLSISVLISVSIDTLNRIPASSMGGPPQGLGSMRPMGTGLGPTSWV